MEQRSELSKNCNAYVIEEWPALQPFVLFLSKFCIFDTAGLKQYTYIVGKHIFVDTLNATGEKTSSKTRVSTNF